MRCVPWCSAAFREAHAGDYFLRHHPVSMSRWDGARSWPTDIRECVLYLHLYLCPPLREGTGGGAACAGCRPRAGLSRRRGRRRGDAARVQRAGGPAAAFGGARGGGLRGHDEPHVRAARGRRLCGCDARACVCVCVCVCVRLCVCVCVCVCVPARGRCSYLQHHGFVPRDNPFDCVNVVRARRVGAGRVSLVRAPTVRAAVSGSGGAETDVVAAVAAARGCARRHWGANARPRAARERRPRARAQDALRIGPPKAACIHSRAVSEARATARGCRICRGQFCCGRPRPTRACAQVLRDFVTLRTITAEQAMACRATLRVRRARARRAGAVGCSAAPPPRCPRARSAPPSRG